MFFCGLWLLFVFNKRNDDILVEILDMKVVYFWVKCLVVDKLMRYVCVLFVYDLIIIVDEGEFYVSMF